VNAQDTPVDSKLDLPLEIAHLLLIDVVGYSKLLVNEQIELLQELNQIVRNTESFRSAEASGHPSLASLNSQSSSSIILFCARGCRSGAKEANALVGSVKSADQKRSLTFSRTSFRHFRRTQVSPMHQGLR
jgi:hypothetical protein